MRAYARPLCTQAKIAAIHRAVKTGALRDVRLLADRKKLALCRDGRGATPLHNAIIFNQRAVVKDLFNHSSDGLNHNLRNRLLPDKPIPADRIV